MWGPCEIENHCFQVCFLRLSKAKTICSDFIANAYKWYIIKARPLLSISSSLSLPFPPLSLSLSLSFLFCFQHHSLSQFVSQYPKVVYLTDKMILFLEMTEFCRHQRPPALPALSPAVRSRRHFFQVPVNAEQTDRPTHIWPRCERNSLVK